MGGREATVTGIAESRTLFDQGTELYKAGKYGDELQAFDRSYALNPRALVRYNQAACLEMMGKRELAAQRYEAYIAEDPRAADVSKVQKHITKLRTDATNAARDAFDRGQEAYLQGNFKAAANAFAEAYEQKPLPQFLYNRAAALDMAGEKKDAVRNYQLYLSTAPKAADADKIRMRIHELLQATGDELMVP
jgi:tetratricopeptide (TPR) repeat protein